MNSEERRQNPRIELNRSVPVRLPNGDTRTDVLKSISLAGMMLECDPATANHVIPSDQSIDPNNPPVVSLVVSLPVGGTEVPMELACRVRYRIAGPGGKVNIGLEFKNVQTENLRGFWQFIEESLLPRQD